MNNKKVSLIKKLANKHGISSYEIAQNTSVSAKTLYNIFNDDNIKPRNSTLNIIIEYLESIETGSNKKSELKDQYKLENKQQIAAEDAAIYNTTGVPYYDIEFAAGFEDFTQNQAINPTSYINHPFFIGCDYVIRASGQSMAKVIKHGDLIGITKVEDWFDFLPFGEIYAIVTTTNFRMIKVISKGSTPDTYTLISKPTENKKEDFPPQEIKKSKILSIFKVQASSYLF